MSKRTPDIQPPAAMPSTVAVSTRLMRVPASRAGIVVAHDQRIARHDAALRKPKEGRDEIERGQAIEGQIEDQSQTLQVEPRISVPAPPIRSAMRPETKRLTTPMPRMIDSISAPRAVP